MTAAAEPAVGLTTALCTAAALARASSSGQTPRSASTVVLVGFLGTVASPSLSAGVPEEAERPDRLFPEMGRVPRWLREPGG